MLIFYLIVLNSLTIGNLSFYIQIYIAIILPIVLKYIVLSYVNICTVLNNICNSHLRRCFIWLNIVKYVEKEKSMEIK